METLSNCAALIAGEGALRAHWVAQASLDTTHTDRYNSTQIQGGSVNQGASPLSAGEAAGGADGTTRRGAGGAAG